MFPSHDPEVIGGDMHDLLVKTLKGDGENKRRVGVLGKQRDLLDFRNQMEKVIAEYNKNESNLKNFFGGSFAEIQTGLKLIPEFETITSLNKGYLTKGDLLMMYAYRGDPDGRQRLLNFGVDLATIDKVLTRELEPRDTALMQNIVNMIKSYRPRVQELQKRNT